MRHNLKFFALFVPLLLMSQLWAGGSVTITAIDGPGNNIWVHNEEVKYKAQWKGDEGAKGSPTSYSWTISGDGTIEGSVPSATITVNKSSMGTKNFSVTCTTTWDAPPEHTPKQASASQTCTIIKLVQFNPDTSSFPKCLKEAMGPEDFVRLTDPAGHEALYGFSAPGTGTKGVHTAKLKYRSDSKETNYEVDEIGDEPNSESLTPDSVNQSFTDIIETELNTAPGGFSFSGAEFKVSGTASGTGDFKEVGGTSWSTCGGGITQSSSSSVTYGVSFSTKGPIFMKAEAAGQISVTWNSVATETLTHPALGPKREIRVVGYEQPVTISTSYSYTERRGFTVSVFGTTSYGPWEPYSRSGSDTTKGYLSKDTQLWWKCCKVN